jgi:two-component system response regulator (stage 0 sporulation protein F)
MPAPGRILIVDDEQAVREVLGEYFTGQGWSVDTAGGGAEALSVVQRARPDLVLLDIVMKDMDGVEVLRYLRRHDQSLPVIMVTAHREVALARETLKIGAFDYITKPFDFRYLDLTVAAALARPGDTPTPAGGEDDAWRRLALAVFRVARQMPPAARVSIGERLEAAVLEAVRAARAWRPNVAAERLAEIDLLLGMAEELGDLPAGARAPVDAARKILSQR